MKKMLFVLLCMLSLGFVARSTPAQSPSQSPEEIFEQFNYQFQAVRPPPGSSINVDYKLDQNAIASYYAVRMLTIISRQNQEMLSRYEELSRKYDQMIKQNDRVILLLTPKPGAPR